MNTEATAFTLDHGQRSLFLSTALGKLTRLPIEVFIPLELQAPYRITRTLLSKPPMPLHGAVKLSGEVGIFQAASTVSCGLTRRESWGASFSMCT